MSMTFFVIKFYKPLLIQLPYLNLVYLILYFVHLDTSYEVFSGRTLPTLFT